MKKSTIITFIIIALILTMVLDFKINGVEVFENYFRHLETESMQSFDKIQKLDFNSEYVSKEYTMNITVSDIQLLSLDNNMGSITITGEKRDDIDLQAIVTVYADKEVQAKDFLKKINIDREIRGGELEVKLHKNDSPGYIRGIKVKYEIKAPAELALNIKNKFGKLKVNNFDNDIRVSNQYDSTVINSIGGKANIDVKYGNLFVSHVGGRAQINSSYNKTNLKKFISDLNLNTSFSKVDIEGVDGSLNFKSKYGGAHITDIYSGVTINSRYTGIEVSDLAGELVADLNYGEFKALNIKNKVDIESEYTDVIMRLEHGMDDITLNCETEYGNIDANLLCKLKEKDNKKIMSAKLGEGTVPINVKTRYGDINIIK